MGSTDWPRVLLGAVLALGLTVALPARPDAQNKPPKVLSYVKPAGRPAPPIDLAVGLTPDKAVARIRRNFERAGLTLLPDAGDGTVAATYRGKGPPWIDCGWIFSFENGPKAPPKRYGGAAAESKILVKRDGVVTRSVRRIRLDGLIAAKVVPEGTGSRVLGHATYVVTRSVADDGDSPVVTRIDFRSGETGSFEKGTTCLPTGQFERLINQGLPRLR